MSFLPAHIKEAAHVGPHSPMCTNVQDCPVLQHNGNNSRVIHICLSFQTSWLPCSQKHGSSNQNSTFQQFLKIIHKELLQRRAFWPLQGVQQLLDFRGHSAVHRDTCHREKKEELRLWHATLMGECKGTEAWGQTAKRTQSSQIQPGASQITPSFWNLLIERRTY